LKKAFLMVAGKAVEKFGMDVEKEQEVLMAAADMAMEIYHLESGILRAEKLAAMNHSNAEFAADMVKLYMLESLEKVGVSGREAIYSFAEGDEQRMLLMGIKRFTKLRSPFNVKQKRRELADKLISDGRYSF
jgi:hypothetical protein